MLKMGSSDWNLADTKISYLFNNAIQSLSAIRQKGEFQNECQRKQGRRNFPKNEHFLPPDKHTSVCVSGGKKCSFFGKLSLIFLLVKPVLKFCLLPYYRRIIPVYLKVNIFWSFQNVTLIWPWSFLMLNLVAFKLYVVKWSYSTSDFLFK